MANVVKNRAGRSSIARCPDCQAIGCKKNMKAVNKPMLIDNFLENDAVNKLPKIKRRTAMPDASNVIGNLAANNSSGEGTIP